MPAIHANFRANVHITERAPARAQRTERREARWQPIAYGRRDRDDRGGHVVDHRWDRDRARPVIVGRAPVVVTAGYDVGWTAAPSYTYAPGPITIAGATALDDNALSIDTSNLLGGATTLQIDAAGSGTTYVSQVDLYDANGDYRVVNLNTMLSPSNPTAQIAIGGGDVARIVINGHSDWDGAIAVQAQ